MVVYINDILIYSRTKEEHTEHLRTMLRTLKEHKLYAKLKECEFCLGKVHFLGYVVTKDEKSVDPTKVEAIVNWPRTTTVIDVRSFLGIASYYMRLVQGFSKLTLPITRLITKNTKVEWV